MTAPVKTEHPHVVRTPGVAGGRPIIAGTRISIDFIVRQLSAGDEPRDILASYPHLSAAALHDAISYYYDHQADVDAHLAASSLEAVAEREGFEVRTDGRIVPKDR